MARELKGTPSAAAAHAARILIALVKQADRIDQLNHNRRMTEGPMDQAEKRRYAADVLRKAKASSGRAVPRPASPRAGEALVYDARKRYCGLARVRPIGTDSTRVGSARDCLWGGNPHAARAVPLGLAKCSLRTVSAGSISRSKTS